MNLHFTPEAKNDLKSIWRYTYENWDESQAESYITALRKTCYQLSDLPSIGKPLPDVGEDVRVYRCQHHYIFYLKQNETITFLAFVHEKRDMLRYVLNRLP